MNEALAKAVERNVWGRGEIVSTAGELAAQQESKDVPIKPDSDPIKRRSMKAVTAVARSGSSQMESSRAVADGLRMDVEEEERYEVRSSKAQNSRRRMMTKASMEEPQMDDEGKERDGETNPEVRQNRTPGEESRQKHHWKRTKVRRQRWQSRRIANIDELETGSSTVRWSQSRRSTE